MSIKENVASFVAEMDKLEKEYLAKATELFNSITKVFFENNPQFTRIQWAQYTPYFNDGDTCEFSTGELIATNSDEVTFHGDYEGEDEGEDEDGDFNPPSSVIIYPHWRKNKVVNEDFDALADLINSSAGQNMCLRTFGDHSSIVITKDGVEVQEYDHD